MELSKLLQKIDVARITLEKNKGFTSGVQRKWDEKTCISTAYHSGLLDGNQLSLDETTRLITDGLTADGKLLADHLEMEGYREAFGFLLEIGRHGKLNFTDEIILDIHFLLCYRADRRTAGIYRTENTGEGYRTDLHTRTARADDPKKNDDDATGQRMQREDSAAAMEKVMQVFLDVLNSKQDAMHGILQAAYAHRGILEILPFSRRNGATARLFMNLVLMNRGYQAISIPPEKHKAYQEYRNKIRAQENPDNGAFCQLIAEAQLDAMEACSKLAGGRYGT